MMDDARLSTENPTESPRPLATPVPPTLAALPRRYLIDTHVRRAATAPDAPPRLRVTGRDTETGQAVFIKLSNDGESIRREADILARFDHPSLARLLDWGMHAAGGYLVLELVPGATLERRLRDDGPVRSTRQVRPLLRSLAEAAGAIHQASILHRDLKPANIVVRPEGSVVIIDFGAACPLSVDRSGVDSQDFASHGYAAPEQYVQGGVEGPWTDIYALAAIAYRIVTGAPPPSAPCRIGEDGSPLPALGQIALADPALAEALAAGLSVDPAQRPQTIDAWSAALADPNSAATGPGLSDAALPPLAPTPLVLAYDRDASPADEDPPTLPIRRVAATRTPTSGTGVTAPAAAAVSRRTWRRPRVLALLAMCGLIIAAIGWLVAPTYRREVLGEWSVNGAGTADARSIGEAIARAPDGARIRIDAGTYTESLVLDRPLTLQAADPAAPPLLAPPYGSCLQISGDGAEVRGLVMQGAPRVAAPITLVAQSPVESGKPANAPACVDIIGGSPLLTDNRITAGVGPAIDVAGGASPLIRGNSVADAPTPAIRVADGARPTIENNTIDDSGSVLFTAAGGTLRGNTVRNARASAIQVAAGANPDIIGNRIERPAEAGIFVYDNGKGRIAENDVTGAKLSGIVVATGAPEIIGNKITDAGEHGILILNAEGARIADNVVDGNKGHAIVVGADSTVEMSGNRTEDNRAPEVVDLRRR
jgi:Serine/threonine protein kinase